MFPVPQVSQAKLEMMIVGTGIDICEVPRIAQSIARFGDRFLERVFAPTEISYCQSKKNSVERFAARFAAKEAAMKALGTGVNRGVTWKQIVVGHAPGGRPTLVLSGKAFEIAKGLGVRRISVSLTHTESTGMAQVIFED
jgi:holo-[acyl-carrier protein] synthase